MPGCTRCGSLDEGKLYAVIGSRSYCADCWHEVGEPFPRDVADPITLEQAEIHTRDRMLARGGTDRHLVRSGKA